ncbi:hypothetical protein BKA63DRAFT_562477 [Paraphoma chrysanthemicola]|nr:hypothetical protein BKA63DRAFT_562477 [Paraphoma chrysanthemicola]
MDPHIVSSVCNDQMNNPRPWVHYESAHQMPSLAVEIHDDSQRNGIDQVRHMRPRRVSNTSQFMPTPKFPSVSARRNSIMTATIPGPFPRQKSSIDEVLNHIDIKRITTAYKNYSYPNIPIVHLATYRLFSSTPFQVDSCVGHNKINAPIDPSGRRMPRCLLYPLLALGAGYSLSPSLSQRLFEEAGLEIRRLLRDYTTEASVALPDVIVIQSLMLYIQYCLSSGSQIFEQIATQHICSLAALVKSASLSSKTEILCPSIERHNPNSALLRMQSNWHLWALREEEKRTYFGAYFVCSAGLILVNPFQPFLGNSQHDIELPCKEPLWEAENATEWESLCISTRKEPTFRTAYADLFNSRRGSINAMSFREISEFGCLVLLLALHKGVWAWSNGHPETNPTCFTQLLDKPDYQVALQSWHSIWSSLMDSTPCSPRGKKILLRCLPVFDHTMISLQVNISPAKDALHTRDYRRTNEFFQSIFGRGIAKTVASAGQAVGEPDTQISDITTQLSYEGCREIAGFAARSLKSSFELSPWWSNGMEAVDVPVISALTVFYCAQIVSCWLTYIAIARITLQTHMDSLHHLGAARRVHVEDFLELEDIGVIRTVIELLNLASMTVDEDIMLYTDIDDVLGLAEHLLHAAARTMERVVAWRVLNHLAEGLRISATLLPHNSKQ